MKYIDAEKLIAEIERMREVNKKAFMAEHITADVFHGRAQAVNHLSSIIDSLQQEQPEVDLEKEIDRFYGMYRKDGETFDLTDNEKCMDWKINCNPDFKIEFAGHFYELGKLSNKK